MTVPNLFIVGAPRCGTTSLYRYLGAHEEIFMSPVKEPHFFGSDLHDPTSIRDERRYRALFERAGRARFAGEASVWYLYSQAAAKEIREFSPDARILILLRNPVDMMLSLHTHHVYTGHQTVEDFRRALELQSEPHGPRGNGRSRSFRCGVSYRAVARYAGQVERFLEEFGSQSVHIVLFEELREDTSRIYGQVLPVRLAGEVWRWARIFSWSLTTSSTARAISS